MKFYAIVLGLLFSSVSFASGKLVLLPEFDVKQEKFAGAAGLSIYEKLGAGPVYLNSFTGAGQTKFQFSDDVVWATQKVMLELPIANWFVVVGLGSEVSYVWPWQELHVAAVGKLSVKLW